MPNPFGKCKITNRLFSLLLPLILSTVYFIPYTSPALAVTPDPKPCFNPVATDNLTDNYITDDKDKGDPPGPQGNAVPDALKFTFIHTGKVGDVPGQNGTQELRKTMTFTANFSKLQAIFGAPTSDYFEGRAQNAEHAQANLLAMKNPELIKHQGPIGKINPTAVTDDLRQKYVNYVDKTPTLAEAKQEFSDYSGQNKKTINQLVQDYKTPTPPGPSDDRTKWISEWGKYWENIPTTYNEFYIGKLEFRPVHGTTAIKDLKGGKPGSCFPNSALRIVEFPVPNFFRSAATSGVMNLAMLPKSAWSDQNDLLGIQGAVAGVKTTASNFIKNCFKFASNNPVTNIIKKVVKISLEKFDPATPVYAAVGANNLSTSGQTCNTTTGQVSIRFNWSPQPDGGYFTKDAQWLDLSLTNDNFTGSFKNTSSPPSRTASSYTTGQAGGQIGPLDPGRTHYWRINTLNSLNSTWYPSPTDSFRTIDCAVRVIVQNATNLATSGQICDATTGRVNVNFNWTPGEEGGWLSRENQWLDLSLTNDNFASAYKATSNPPSKDAGSYTTGQSGGQIGSLDPGKTHFWRINTHYLNENWHSSATGSFTTLDCHPTIDPPVITRVGNNKNVTFTFSPASDGNFILQVWAEPNPPGEDAAFDSNFIPSGHNQVTWTNATRGHYRVILLNRFLAKITYDPDVTFDVTYTLDPPVTVNRDVTFTWAPPIHIAPSVFGGVAIDVTRIDVVPPRPAWNSGGLPKDSSTITWKKASPGDYKACIILYPNVLDNACQTFHISLLYSWTFFDLSDKSCIKVGKQGKAGNAPFCAIYPDKFDAAHNTVINEIEPAKNIKSTDNCNAGTNTIFKLNTDSSNVVCTFTFEWRSSDYDRDPNKWLKIPATGDGNWDSCDEESGGFRTCYLTVGVWPDFRVPYLGQIWNNSLYSDTNEYLPTNQDTGRPGVYSLLQPKAVAEELAKDPIQIMIDKCEADPTKSIDEGGGCHDLANWGATHSTQYPGFGDCVGKAMLDPTHLKLITCFDLVAHSIVDNKLPGEVNSATLGVNTNSGSVLGASDGNQKERLIGAVDCGKHFSRDIALKPKALQQSLGIQQDCNLTASALPPGSSPPPSVTPTTPPIIIPPADCHPASDGNPANGIETGRNELVCYITQVAAGKVEKKTGQPLDQVMIRVMDAESSGGNQCATPPGGGAGEIGIFQYVAATWKSVGGLEGVDSGTFNPGSGNACWGTPGGDPIATTLPPAGSPNMFSWIANFGVNLDGDAWNPYHQIDATATDMEVSGGCPWSTFKDFYPGVCP